MANSFAYLKALNDSLIKYISEIEKKNESLKDELSRKNTLNKILEILKTYDEIDDYLNDNEYEKCSGCQKWVHRYNECINSHTSCYCTPFVYCLSCRDYKDCSNGNCFGQVCENCDTCEECDI